MAETSEGKVRENSLIFLPFFFVSPFPIPDFIFDLSADEKRVLLHARTKGVIKNADCRAVVPLDTLSMSTLLKRLRNKGILVQQGKGSATCYSIAPEYSDIESKESKSN